MRIGVRPEGSPGIEVRRVRPEDWEAARDVRLRALAHAPDAFTTTFDEAAARPVEWWREWAMTCSTGEQALFLAWDGSSVVGMVGTFADDEGTRWLFGMWVDPSVRGRGVGSALVATVVEFARAAGAGEIRLSVIAGNTAARALYEREGFVWTDRIGDEDQMRRAWN